MNSKIKKMRTSRSKGLIVSITLKSKIVNIFPRMVKNDGCIIIQKDKFWVIIELKTKILFSKIVMNYYIAWKIYKYVDDNIKPIFVFIFLHEGCIINKILYILCKDNRNRHIND
jgi:hypothetical protein